MTDRLFSCPQCGRLSAQPPNVTAVTCMSFASHKRNEAVEMEEVEVDETWILDAGHHRR